MIRVTEVKGKDGKSGGLAVDNAPASEADHEAQQLAMQEHFKIAKIVSIEALTALDAKQNRKTKVAPPPSAQYWKKMDDLALIESMPEPTTIDEMKVRKSEIAIIHAELAALEVMTDAPAPPEPQAAPVATDAKPVKTPPPNWLVKESEYIANTWRNGRFTTAKDLYNALFSKAGIDGSPFKRGTGNNRDSIVYMVDATSISLKTFQNNWSAIKAIPTGG